VSFSIERDIINSASIAQFLVQGTGTLTTTGTQAMGFFSTSFAKKANESSWPDIQTILIGVSVGENFASDFSRGFGLKHGQYQRYLAHAVGRDSFMQIVSLARPRARGYIKLRNADPQVPLLIHPNYFEDQEDVDTIVEGMKKAVALIENTTAFAEIGGTFTDQVFPGCEAMRFRSDQYWECYARHLSITLHHIVGSCSMGKATDPYAVVDSQLRVLGIDFLRVVDASVMPSVPVGNTNSPTMMIAEKAADMIIRYWGADKRK
jgi:choline dehydrogenase-like flavoprotein